MEKNMILGLFTKRADVETLMGQLQDSGFHPQDVSIIMKDNREANALHENTGASVGGNIAGGAVTGGIIGGIAGLLAAIAIPGLGAFLVGGPIAASLGLTGAAASTVSGAATGVVAGGILGALMSLGLPKEEAQMYEQRIQQGAILVAVPTDDIQTDDVKDLFDSYHAEDIKILPMQENDQEIVEEEDVVQSEEPAFTPSFQVSGTKGGEQRRDDRPSQTRTHHRTTHRRGKKGGQAAHVSSSHHVNPIQVQKYLKGVDYPCTKEDLLDAAENEGADQNVLDTLHAMPGRSFDSPNDVAAAIGKIE